MSYTSDPVNVEVRGPNPWAAIIILGVLTGLLGIWLMVSALGTIGVGMTFKKLAA